MRLTREERQAGIYIKSLIIAKDNQGNIVRVMSPQACTLWVNDGASWLLDATIEPSEKNTSGIYATTKATEARKYLGTLCKVVLSGVVIEHETGARGQRARLLEVGK